MKRSSSSPVSTLPRVAIVVSRYTATVTDRLLTGAVGVYRRAGGRTESIYIAEAPGAFELVAIASAAARCGRFAGVLALGCIVKGETRHDEYLAHAVTAGLCQISERVGVPVGLGVLTVNTPQQALDRVGGKHGHKGEEAMLALLATIAEVAAINDGDALDEALASGVTLDRLMRPAPGGLDAPPDKLRKAERLQYENGKSRPVRGRAAAKRSTR